jgi:glutamate-1-semialdehyde 2,1-aminomutase
MLQYYLRAEGLALSWVGTGRLIFSLDIDDALFEEIVARVVQAGRAMLADGWWDGPAATNKQLRRQALKESLAARLKGR